MPETPVATTGAPAAIASTSTFGIPSRSFVEHAARHAQRAGAAVLAQQLVLAHRARQLDAVAEPGRGDPLAHDVAVLVVLADDQRLERHVAAAQLGARVDEDVEALLGHQPADAEHAQACRWRRGAAGGSRTSRAKSALRPW